MLEELVTEKQNEKTLYLDQLSLNETVDLMTDQEIEITEAIRKQKTNIELAITKIIIAFEKKGRLIYVGAGTSGRLGVLDAAECVPTFGVSPDQVIGILAGGKQAMFSAIEGAEDNYNLGVENLKDIHLTSKDVVVGISASGRTPYVIGALEYANQQGATTVALSCNANSKIGEISQIKIEVEVGPEIVSGSTRLKAGTAQKEVLNMLSTISMIKSGKVYGNLMVDVKATNMKLKGRAARILSSVTAIDLEKAKNILEENDYKLKMAIVMVKKNISAEEAYQLLVQTNGFVRKALGEDE